MKAAASSWREQRLGDVLQLEYGKPLNDADRAPNGRYPAYGANGEKARTDRYYCDNPSIIVGRKGSAGEINLTEEKFWPLDVTYFVTFDRAKHDLQFLFYLLMTLNLPRLAKGVKPGLNRNEVYAQMVRVPSLPEQRRVVATLDEAVEGLVRVKTNAETNIRNASALFESQLNSFFSHGGDGWREASVNELVAEGTLVKPFDGNHGEIHPRKTDYVAAGVPFIMASDLTAGSVDTVGCTFISRRLADSLRVGFAKDGDVLLSHKGTIGRSAIVRTDDDYIMLTPQVTSYRIKQPARLFNRFLRYYFMSPVFLREFIAGAEGGATRAYIGITRQLTLRIRFPAIQVQHEISAKLDELEPDVRRLESVYRGKLAAIEALRRSLMQRAFSGHL